MESVKPRFAVEAHLANLFAEETAEEVEQVPTQGEPVSSEPGQKEGMASPVELPTAISPEQCFELTQQNEERHDWIERQGRLDREVTHGTYQRVADFRISTTVQTPPSCPRKEMDAIWATTPTTSSMEARHASS